MKLRATAWLLLVIWTDMGLTKHGGDYESLKQCQEGWQEMVACWKNELKDKNKIKYKDWGQPSGFCIEAERLNAPGIIYPIPKPSDFCG